MKIILSMTTMIALVLTTTICFGQGITTFAPPPQYTQPQATPQYAQPQYAQPQYTQPTVVQPSYPSTVVVPQPVRPSVPVYVTPNQFNGYNLQTGGVNTWNQQVNNSAFDYGRNSSAGNGSARPVSRPVYGANGQIVGYEQGTEWFNENTNRMNGNTTVTTSNSSGGSNTTLKMYSGRR